MVDDIGFSREAIQRASYVALVVTSVLGFVAGLVCYALYRVVRQFAQMSVLASVLTLLVAGVAFAGIHVVRYQIQEAPFELTGDLYSVYIHPGLVSMYLPALAVVAGFVAAWAVRRGGERPN